MTCFSWSYWCLITWADVSRHSNRAFSFNSIFAQTVCENQVEFFESNSNKTVMCQPTYKTTPRIPQLRQALILAASLGTHAWDTRHPHIKLTVERSCRRRITIWRRFRIRQRFRSGDPPDTGGKWRQLQWKLKRGFFNVKKHSTSSSVTQSLKYSENTFSPRLKFYA